MALDVVGKLARVTADITPNHLGEVLIEVRAGTERFLARAADQQATIRKHASATQTTLQAEAQAKAVKLAAGAQAEATRLNGQAEADAIKARGLAEVDAIRARMEAEAAGIERRAAALSQNQEAVIAQQIAERLPEIVAAAAAPFEHIKQFTVLSGAQGVTGALAEIIQQAGALTGLARESLMPAISGNGALPKAGAPAKADPTTPVAAEPAPPA